MVNTCVVYGCTNRSKPGDTDLKFFDIPKLIKHQGIQTEELSIERRRVWLARINRANFDPDPTKRHLKVCSDHFITGLKADLFDKTNPDWAPSIRLGHSSESSSESSKKRYVRQQARNEKQIKSQTVKALPLQESTQLVEPNIEGDSSVEVSNSSKRKCTFSYMGTIENNVKTDEELEIERLKQENLSLKEKLNAGTGDITPETFTNDEKAKHYTGLRYIVLMSLFTFLEPHISQTSKSSLSRFQKLVLVLMKLRLNLGIQDLGYRFKVTPSCVSKVFLDMIHVMYIRMKCLILWPEREELQTSMPMEFRKYFGVKVSIIIDCFEVFIDRPSNLLAQAETWSNYKHHNTVKYLIGITPQGAVSYLSNGYGGRVSDKHLTEDCGMLQKLLPGDIVLADRGFNITESVGLQCAEVKIPAFTKGKKQLSPLELEATRKIAHTRIHVERVIGLVRNKYTILQSTIPIDYLHCQSENVPTMDKITTVCCALTNLCDSVVPFD
ncbi:unnamed protein product [Mytilus coruscus]|uniref:THAP-type domain-containing protein n=1 Tax=Mytilus coruscus TaxID=42192 RepID=A0A6J8D594_MYTCO|nr:unnamed protein product [Mytilus coruscus]